MLNVDLIYTSMYDELYIGLKYWTWTLDQKVYDTLLNVYHNKVTWLYYVIFCLKYGFSFVWDSHGVENAKVFLKVY